MDKNRQLVKFLSFTPQLLILSESSSKYKQHERCLFSVPWKELNISEVQSLARLEAELF